MGKVKQWSVEKKDQIEKILITMWTEMGMSIPVNYEDIVQDCYEDVCETADPILWGDKDVAIAFQRWIESKSNVQEQNVQETPNYFSIVHQGFNKDMQREEIQIHCGENGNLMILKTDMGFIVDVYGQNDLVHDMEIFEDELNPIDPDEKDISKEINQESAAKLDNVIRKSIYNIPSKKWGKAKDITKDFLNSIS